MAPNTVHPNQRTILLAILLMAIIDFSYVAPMANSLLKQARVTQGTSTVGPTCPGTVDLGTASLIIEGQNKLYLLGRPFRAPSPKWGRRP